MNYLDPTLLALLGFGGIIYVMVDKSTMAPCVRRHSLADVVGYSELKNEVVNPLRYGQNPIKTEFAECYIGPYGLKVYEMKEPASGNWTPIWIDHLHW